MIRPAHFIPQTKRINDLLREFQALHIQMAIVTNESGVIESIVDNVTGFGVPERDSLAISKKIIYILDNIDIKSKMDKNALERAINDFTWDKIILKYQDKILQL